MSKNINGPINIIRLEGSINSIKKVLYVFLDFHMSHKVQTKCEDYFSDDVTKYIKSEMLKTDVEIDFFMEHRLSKNDVPIDKYKKFRDIYIQEMDKFFYENFKNKSKEFKKIRFHYADIRDTYIIFSHRDINNLLYDYSCNDYNRNTLNMILNKYSEALKYIYDIIDIFNGKDIKTNITSLKEIKKTQNKYSNKNVKKINRVLIDLFIKKATKLKELISENYNLLISHETECKKYYDDNGHSKLIKEKNGNYSYFFNDDEQINIIKNNQNNITDLGIETYSLIMDIYFLRRFCDKDYVKNALFYGGGAHGILYINFLLHYYDFNITHASYHLHTIDKTNILLKDKFNDGKFYEELLSPPILIQCSDVSELPEKFK
jgi:hypothetical protein